MSNKNKTALALLYEGVDNRDMGEVPIWVYNFIQKAKEIEKEQIIDTWNTRAKIDGILTFTDNRTAEQYYKETYEENI
tara:strand:+ start:154 stop:387 length:234 start_codon:yes stop_codon:yes gene_type:complete